MFKAIEREARYIFYRLFVPVKYAKRLFDKRLYDEAKDVLIPFLQRNPKHPFGCYYLGNIHRIQGDYEKARALLLEAAKGSPKYARAAMQYAASICEPDSIDEFRRLAQAANPSPEYYVYSELYVPWVQMTKEDAAKWYEYINTVFARLQHMPLQLSPNDELAETYFFGIFTDAEQNIKDGMELRRQYTRFLTRSCPELTCMPETPRQAEPAEKQGVLRLGVVVWRYDVTFSTGIGNILKRIDRDRFEVVLFRPAVPPNEHTAYADSTADAVVEYEHADWRKLRELILSKNIDILMQESFTTLAYNAFARLAPVQCTFSDPIVPMALPEIDYLLLWGGDRKIASWRDQFAEKIVSLGNNLIWADHRSVEPDTIDRKEFGIPEGARILFTWQVWHRWRLGDYKALAQILRQNDDIWLLTVTEAIDPAFVHGLKIMGDVSERIKPIRRLSPERFAGMLNLATAVIAPPYTPGFMSSSSALSRGMPIVICKEDSPAQCAMQLLYEKMGIVELIANTLDEYVAITQRLLDDEEWRESKSREILNGLPKMYNLDPYIDELQDFLEAAFAKAQRGECPMHWCNGEFIP